MEENNNLREASDSINSDSDIDYLLDKDKTDKSVIKKEEIDSKLIDQDKTNKPLIKQEEKDTKLIEQDKTNKPLIKQEEKDSKLVDQDKTNKPLIKQEEKDSKLVDQDKTNKINPEDNLSKNNLNLDNKNKTPQNNEGIKKTINTDLKAKVKPVKELPIEKKPFDQFINDHLIPELKIVFSEINREISNIEMKKTNRPISGDECWVLYCEIKETCSFWLSFDRDDITSSKSFSLCKTNEKPSIIESFLIDEKKTTLKLIISRILQRLNGQKLIGAN